MAGFIAKVGTKAASIIANNKRVRRIAIGAAAGVGTLITAYIVGKKNEPEEDANGVIETTCEEIKAEETENEEN